MSNKLKEISKKLLNNAHSEFLIQVDKNNKVIGKISKYDAHLKTIINQGILHRAFSLYIFDKGNLLLQRRSSYKATFSNLWTNSCCSHPLFIESELEEENDLGIKRAA